MFVAPNTEPGDLVSRPSAGMMAGAIGALAMLAAAALTQGRVAVEAWLDQIGHAIRPGWAAALPAIPVAVVLHLAVGAVLGALHAACQQRTAASGLIAVGLFYGFLIWLVSGVILVRWWGVASPLSVGWPGLAATLVYGVVLATWATYSQRLSDAKAPLAKPVD